MSSIYVLLDPRTGELRYVGKTTQNLNRRLWDHLCDPTDSHRTRWIKKLRRVGLRPYLQRLQTVARAEDAEAEKYWIKYFKAQGCRLVNSTDGGEGVLGLRHSAETRAKISVNRRGKGLGRPVSGETRKRISEAKKGRKQTPEHTANHAAAIKGHTFNRGRVHTEETRAKNSASHFGKKHPPESRARISAALTGRPCTPERRAAIINGKNRLKHGS